MRCLDIPGSRYCCLVETLSSSHFEAWSWNQGHYRTNKKRKRERERALWSKARQTRTNTRIASSLPWATEMIFRFTFKHNWRAVLSLSSSLPPSFLLSLSRITLPFHLFLSNTLSLCLFLLVPRSIFLVLPPLHVIIFPDTRELLASSYMWSLI